MSNLHVECSFLGYLVPSLLLSSALDFLGIAKGIQLLNKGGCLALMWLQHYRSPLLQGRSLPLDHILGLA